MVESESCELDGLGRVGRRRKVNIVDVGWVFGSFHAGSVEERIKGGEEEGQKGGGRRREG